jgi:peptidoglycan/xylan/chitin deacetylase (PgdA/CDA1 family)
MSQDTSQSAAKIVVCDRDAMTRDLRQMTLAGLRKGLSRRAAVALRTRTIRLRNTDPVVTFSFDDCPVSAVTEGARLLEQRGVRGSFYLCGGLADRTWENGPQFSVQHVRALVQQGHEIGCHTFNHVSCNTVSAAELLREIGANRDFFKAILGDYSLTTFAYPYGRVGLQSKLLMQRQFAACRGVDSGLNSGTADLGLLKSVALPSDSTPGTAAARAAIGPWLQRARAQNSWLILCAHDVSTTPTPYGCTPDTLAATIDAVLEAGYEILPTRDALRRVSFGLATAPTPPQGHATVAA